MSAPLLHAIGDVVAGTSDIVLSWPDHTADDIGVILVENANQIPSTPAGWTALASTGTGTAGATAATGIAAFWKRAASGTEANVTITDPGARAIGVLLVFRGCLTSGSPIDVSATSVQATVSAAVSIPGVTTTQGDELVVNVLTNSLLLDDETLQPSTLTNASVSNLTKRLNTQPDGVNGGATDASLPVGLMAFGSGDEFGDVGEGPDLTTAAPKFTACHYVPNINTIGAQIDTADANNILLVLHIAGNKSSYTTTIGGTPTLDMAKYTDNVRKFRPDADNTAFADRLKFADAVRRRRIVFYVVDEPYLTNSFNNNLPNITPQQTNQMGLLIKSVWADYSPITIVRAGADRLAAGWLGQGIPTGGYTGIDYCWLQYEQRLARGAFATQPWTTPFNPTTLLAEQRSIIASNNLDMGVIPSLNLWAGGIGRDFLGVSAAWDTDGPGGSSTLGYVIGIQNPGEGTVVTTLTDSVRSLMSSPDWIRKFVDLMVADADIPCYFMWQVATSSNPASSYLTYFQRQDIEDALDYSITAGAARTSFTGWRTAK